MVTVKTLSYASNYSDARPMIEDIIYYDLLTDIIELNYYDRFKVILFKCDLVDVTRGRGLKQDALGLTDIIELNYYDKF